MDKNICIPALDRGLKILEYLICFGGKARYSELKSVIPGITDASLNRLLKSLICSGQLEKKASGDYQLSEKVLKWGKLLSEGSDILAQAQFYVHKLSESLHESVAFAMFNGNRIAIGDSISVSDSIKIIEPGQTLHFEDDHAGAMAIMTQFDEATLKYALNSQYSKIASKANYLEALKTIQKDDYFLDKSLLRPGISRISVSIPTKEGAAALYICSLTPTAKQYEDKLAEALRKCKNEWLKNLTN